MKAFHFSSLDKVSTKKLDFFVEKITTKTKPRESSFTLSKKSETDFHIVRERDYSESRQNDELFEAVLRVDYN